MVGKPCPTKKRKDSPMIKKTPDSIDSLTDPLEAMTQQLEQSFRRSILYAGTPTRDKANETHMHLKKEIKNYMKENKSAPALTPGASYTRKPHGTRSVFRLTDSEAKYLLAVLGESFVPRGVITSRSLFLVVAMTSEVSRLRGRSPNCFFHQERCWQVFEAFLGFEGSTCVI